MAFVPGFEHDVFISYAHVDDDSLLRDEPGWISAFHEQLQILLARKLGRHDSFSIWRDPKTRGNDVLDETIEAVLRRTALGLFVVSRGFVASEWCRRELDCFCSQEHPRLEERLPGRSRVFKVLLSHVPEDEVPPPLKRPRGHAFYELNRTSQRAEPFRRTRESDQDQRYWTALDDLALDLEAMLRQMRSVLEEGPEEGPAAAPAAPAVYLAEVTDDLEPDREDLRRTLLQQGVTVLPEGPLPIEAETLATSVEAQLRRSALSVHMIGPLYGKRPAGETRSYSHLQLDRAAAVASETGMPRLLWMPRRLDRSSLREEQRLLLESVENELDSDSPVEVLRTSVEELKETVLGKLEELFPAEKTVSPDPPGTLVYISCQPEDDPHADEIRGVLRSARHDVILPARSGDRTAVERHHLTNVKYCDVLLVLYGASSVIWVREEILKARDLLGLERRGSARLISVLHGPPPSKVEVGLDFNNLLLIDCRHGFQPERLQPLLKRLGARA